MKILLANETAVYPHVGCLAVGDAHARMLGNLRHRVVHRYFFDELKQFVVADDTAITKAMLHDSQVRAVLESVDAVIVNGEGSIHHGAGRQLLGLLAASQSLKKPTFLVNAVFQEVAGFQETISKLDDFVLRDARSYEYAKSLGYRCRLAADSFLAAAFTQDAFDFASDRVVITDWHLARDADVGAACAQLLGKREDGFFLPLESCSAEATWRNLPATVSRSKAIVTGRHHGVYLGLLAGRPIVALGSNTFKIEGLCEMLGIEQLFCRNLQEVEIALEQCLTGKFDFGEIIQRFLERFPLNTLENLGKSSDSSQHLELQSLQNDVVAWKLRNASKPQMWSIAHQSAISKVLAYQPAQELSAANLSSVPPVTLPSIETAPVATTWRDWWGWKSGAAYSQVVHQ